jgi:D-sedoheptulose 7-phosphate isomerase
MNLRPRNGSTRPAASVSGDYLRSLARLIDQVPPDAVAGVVACLADARKCGARVYVLGNGGSAATASHLVCDLTKATNPPLRAHSLADNLPLFSAFANDTSYADAFAHQVSTYVERGDVVIAISASGNSPNVVEALQAASSIGAKTIALVGFGGGEARALADVEVHVPSHDYGLVEDVHSAIGHAVCQALRETEAHAVASALAGTIEQVFAAAPAPGTNGHAVFVDRDGVINANRNGHVRSWEDFEVLPGALDALALLAGSGRRVFVVTNQSMVGRGLASRDALLQVHTRLAELVSENGGSIEAALTCPHVPDDACGCRKPEPGMLLGAADRFGVALDESVMIGDHFSDLEAAERAGCASILVLSGRVQTFRTSDIPSGCLAVVPNLLAAAELLAGSP